MKKLSSLTFLIVIIMFANLMGQWEILNEGGESYRTIDFINDQVGWIAGEGTLLKTEDGGDTWNLISMDSAWNIREIDFVNETIGWAKIIDEKQWDNESKGIIKTIDGGHTWSVQQELIIPNDNDYSMIVLNAVNDTLVYVTTYDEKTDLLSILKTENSGTTWNDISPYNNGRMITSIWFQNIRKGSFIGSSTYFDEPYYGPLEGAILKTDDGGATLEEIVVPEFRRMYDLQIINNSTAYFLATKGYREDTEYFLCTTTDTLNSWSIVYQHPPHMHSSINYIYCLDERTIFAIMTDSTWTRSFMKSTDGGISWEINHTIRTWDYWGGDGELYFTDTDVGFIVGENIAIYGDWCHSWFSKTIDGGENWIIEKMDYPSLNDVFFFDQNSGIAAGGWVTWCHGGVCGYDGDLFSTNDGGKTWTSQSRGGMIKAFFFIDEMTGFNLSDENGNPCCYKTNDGGKTWTKVYENNHASNGYRFWGNDISFLNQKIGWTAGTYNTGPYNWDTTGVAILGTNNGGESWDVVWKVPSTDENTNYKLNSIYATGEVTWAVGDIGMILKYTRQDGWQMQNTITDLPLNKVFFYNQQHGWIAGGYFDDDNEYLILLKTIDGGKNWKEILNFNYHINDIFFADSLHGWAVGNDTTYNGIWGPPSNSGILLETHDGGNNWNVFIEGLSAPLNAIHFKDGYGWAVGKDGLVLRTEDGLSWIDQNTGKIYPTNFHLSQNYPNPFNPVTMINYQLPMTNEVDLSIYNLLGQKVVTLVSEKQKAGYHQVEWNALGFASGIYYYSIKAGEFQDVKKMVLLR